MNFFGINHYETINPNRFHHIPNLKKPKRKVKSEYNFSEFNHFLYQMNIAQILQWIDIVEKHCTIPVSSKLYLLDFRKPNQQNIFICREKKVNIVERFGKTGLKFLKKICQNCREYPALFNEYFVTMYGLNFLRFKIPTFNFSYSFYKKNQLISFKQEYSEGEDLSFFLTHCSMDDFYTVFLQIVISLEIAQKELLFTHYDLHLENILVESVDKPFSMQVLNKVYTFDKYKVKIIDFGFSCVTVSPTDIFSSCSAHSLYKNGYFPFFTPGTDLFRLLGSIAFETSGNKRNFTLFIMKKLYNLEDSKIMGCRELLRSKFFNCSNLDIIYTIPLECLAIANTLEEDTFLSFGIESRPSVTLSNDGEKTFQLTHQNKFKEIFSLDSIYKHVGYNPLGKLYESSLETSMTLSSFVIPKTVPLFLMMGISDIANFYEKHANFLNLFHPSTHRIDHHKFYRTLSCMKQYLYFAHHPHFRFSDNIRLNLLANTKTLHERMTQ